MAEALERVDMAGLADRQIGELSGGQRRRVAIARAMCARPALLLFDDPTTGLDPVIASSVDDEIVKLRDLEHVTSILATHQIRDAYYVSQHRAVREGVGLFDLSPFGKIRVEGPDAEAVLQRICANDVAVEPGRIVYTQWLNRRGGIEADLTVTRWADDAFMVITGAAEFEWLLAAAPAMQRAGGPDIATAAELVERHIAIKVSVVARDEREAGLRKVLNTGHTIGHAIETAVDYGMLHGECVGIGLRVEAAIARVIRTGSSRNRSRGSPIERMSLA